MAISSRELDLTPGYDPRGILDLAALGGGGALDSGQWAAAMYYRNPLGFRDGKESLWINYGDTSDPYYVLRQVNKGFQLLKKYGRCPGYGPANSKGDRDRISSELWTPILTHPDGPAEFPAEQVKAMGWFKPIIGRRGENGQGCQSLHGRLIRFPQLIAALEAGRISVKQTRCPECSNRTFFEPWHLARHLRNAHQYDPKQIFDMGESLGVDFKQTMAAVFGTGGVEVDYRDAVFDDVAIQDANQVVADEYAKYAEVTEVPRVKNRSIHAVPAVPETITDPETGETVSMADVMARLAVLERERAQLVSERDTLMEIVAHPTGAADINQPVAEAVQPVLEAVEEVKGSRGRRE